MKKIKSLIHSVGVLCLLLSIAACKSTPPAQTEAPVVEPSQNVSQVAQAEPADDALTALRDRAEALRNECVKYGLDTYKAADWALAEAARAAGLEAYGKTYEISKKSFEEAISRYEAILADSMDKLTAELDAALVSARAGAIAAGADSYYPEQFGAADAAAEQTRSLKASGDLAASYEAGQKALMRYQFLQQGMEAVALKQKIIRNQFEQADPDNFALAGTKYDEALASYPAAEAAALESMTESVRLYAAVNNAGYKALSSTMVVTADDAKALCDSIKARKTSKDEYDAASASYTAAKAAALADNWESAYNAYSSSSEAFSAVYQKVLLKKNAADAAIAAAKNRQTQSSDLAAKADEIAPLAENAEGYSEEPYVIDAAPAPVPPVSTTEPAASVAEPAESADLPAAAAEIPAEADASADTGAAVDAAATEAVDAVVTETVEAAQDSVSGEETK